MDDLVLTLTSRVRGKWRLSLALNIIRGAVWLADRVSRQYRVEFFLDGDCTGAVRPVIKVSLSIEEQDAA